MPGGPSAPGKVAVAVGVHLGAARGVRRGGRPGRAAPARGRGPRDQHPPPRLRLGDLYELGRAAGALVPRGPSGRGPGPGWVPQLCGPLDLSLLPQALPARSAREAVEGWAVWGGVPRYWELAADYGDLWEAVADVVLDPMRVLHQEPQRLLLDDMREVARAGSLLARGRSSWEGSGRISPGRASRASRSGGSAGSRPDAGGRARWSWTWSPPTPRFPGVVVGEEVVEMEGADPGEAQVAQGDVAAT